MLFLPGERTAFNRTLRVTVIWLISIDLLLIAALVAGNILRMLGYLSDLPDRLAIAREDSIAEILNYLKWFTCVCCFAACLWLKPSRYQAFLLALFVIILADDSLLLHETYGWTAASLLSIPEVMGLEPKEIGEAVIFGLMGLVSLFLLFLAYRSASQGERHLVARILFIILGLAVTGVLIDAIHHMSGAIEAKRLRRIMGLALTLIEDGGEMILASLATGYSLGALAEVRAADQAVWPRSIRR